MKTDRFWIAVLIIVLIASAAAALILRRATADKVNIFQDGLLIRQIDLSAVKEPYSFTIESAAGTNIVTVEPGCICISDASCPDRLCVRQGRITGGSMPIVCLPHRLVIVPEKHASPAVDAIVG